jgi:hypothetical protein
MKKSIFLFLVLMEISFSQSSIEWVSRSYESASNYFVFDAAIDGNENIYITGSDGIYSNKLAKINSAGLILWIKTYPFTSAYDIKIDNAGNIYLGGSKRNLYDDFWVIKYDPEGNVVWENSYTYNGYRSDICLEMIVDNAGNVYATGYVSTPVGYKDYCTIKYNSDGTRSWVKTFHYGADDEAKSITLDNDNNVLVTGEVYDSNSTQNYCTIKYNPAGELIWYKITPGVGKKIVSGNSDLFVTGRTGSLLGTVSYSSSGNLRWIQLAIGSYNDMLMDNAANLVITGQSLDSISQTVSALLLKYSQSGTLLWTANYASGNYSFGKSISSDQYNNIYVLGVENPNLNNNLVTIKYNESGNQIWLQPYMNIIDSFYTAVKVLHSNGKVYSVANVLRRDSLRYELIIIKYSQTIGINTISTETPEAFSLKQNYPNPFNPTTNFEFRIADFGFVNLTIYDAMGREVETLVNGELKPGTYKAEWNASNYPSGVYFYRLNTENFFDTKKMMLIK